MNIYIVQPGDSLFQIAEKYGVSPEAIYDANRLGEIPYLIVGQALVIPSPETTYTVRAGDSVWSIARKFGINPENIIALNGVTNPNALQIGTVLRIPGKSKNYGYIEVNGYIEPSTPTADTLKISEVGEYLTYVSPFSYQVKADGTLIPVNDDAVLQEAARHRIAPLMVVTNFSAGNFNTDLIDSILASEVLQDTLIGNIILTLEQKGYYGVNIDFERISPENRNLYNDFLRRVVAALHPLGYVVSTALAPKPSDYQTGSWHGAHDYAAHGEIVDFVIIMTYEWGCPAVLPMPWRRSISWKM